MIELPTLDTTFEYKHYILNTQDMIYALHFAYTYFTKDYFIRHITLFQYHDPTLLASKLQYKTTPIHGLYHAPSTIPGQYVLLSSDFFL